MATFDDFYDAAVFGDLSEVRTLLASDSNLVRAADKWGFTALHGVAGEHHLEMAKLLLDAGANPNAGNDEGITPLHLAAYPQMVELLVKYRAEINAPSNNGRTPLIVQAAEADTCDIMEALLKLGADADIRDASGKSARDYAAARGEGDKVDLLDRYRNA